jgi:hypothetical protein
MGLKRGGDHLNLNLFPTEDFIASVAKYIRSSLESQVFVPCSVVDCIELRKWYQLTEVATSTAISTWWWSGNTPYDLVQRPGLGAGGHEPRDQGRDSNDITLAERLANLLPPTRATNPRSYFRFRCAQVQSTQNDAPEVLVWWL